MASGIWHLACQTYALNLIYSHSGQKQAPQLFSSPKSFRVAKSTPSSAKLPPISKWLFKPPLLFKLPLLSKSALFLAPLLLLSYTQDTEALTAYTSRAIEGSAPYLTFDGGRTKVTDTNNLLYIKLPDGRTITPSTNTSSSTNPIMVSAGITFNDIHMVIPSGSTATSLNSLINQGKWGDDDGDGQGVNGLTASGSISLTIKDKDGTTVSRGDTLSKCSAPYKVTLSSTGGSLTTQYGLPNRSTFIGGSVEYYIKLDSSGSCYFVQLTRPGMDRARGEYAGPANMWDPDKGFLTQSTSPSSYDRNFPTTGLDGLSFYLDIPTGVRSSDLSWTVNTRGSLGATVNGSLVILHGPKASSSQISSSNPTPLTRPSLPQTFELVGRDRSGNEVRYGFVLKQWFVSRNDVFRPYNNQLAWCNSLGYRMSRVKDLTSAKCGVDTRYFPCVNGVDGAKPSSGFNHYQHHIGTGFFGEWSSRFWYTVDGLQFDIIWTSDVAVDSQFYVGYLGGQVRNNNMSNGYVLCTTP